MTPTLSICVPTFNRARLLRTFLEIVEEEVRTYCKQVELAISDNCSTDGTEQLVREFEKVLPIRYRKMTRNTGGTYNIVTVVTQLATGKYCWVLGDDDLLRPGAVAKMLEIIEKNPGIPYIFVNHSYESEGDRQLYLRDRQALNNFDPQRLLCHEPMEGYVGRWEEIIFRTEVQAIFTFIGCHVFQREIWLRRSAMQSTDELLDVFNVTTYWNAFPHVEMLVGEMTGKRAYYVGHPYVALFVGNQEWIAVWPRLLFSLILKIPDQIENHGGLVTAARRYRAVIFRRCEREFRELVWPARRNPGGSVVDTGHHFRKGDDVSILRMTLKFWRMSEYWKLLGNTARWVAKQQLKALSPSAFVIVCSAKNLCARLIRRRTP